MQSGHFDVLRVEFSVLAQHPPNEAEGLKLQNWLLINSTSHLLRVVVGPLIGYWNVSNQVVIYPQMTILLTSLRTVLSIFKLNNCAIVLYSHVSLPCVLASSVSMIYLRVVSGRL